jgi:GDPmannose 4,6-dehydratase
MINQIKNNKNIIKVLNSRSKVDLLSANDAVEAMYKIMQLKKPDNFIISSNRLISVKDLFLELKKQTKKNLKLIDLKKDILNKNNSLKGDNSKLKRKCKWKPKDSLGSIIEEFLNKS